jgi:integrase
MHMAGKREWNDGEMRDGIRKVRNARLSKEAGKDVFSFKVPYRDANNKQTSETFTAHAAAVRFRNKIRRQRDEGLAIDPKAGRISVKAYAELWLEGVKAKRPGTYTVYESQLRLHVLPVLGGRQLRSVTREDIQKLVNTLSAHLAPQTVRGVYRTMRAMFRMAYLLDRKIAETPCVRIALPEVPDRKVTVLTAPQIDALTANTARRWAAAIALSAGTGLRISEISGLTWDRVDLEAGTITVDRQMTPKRRLGPVKTRKSNRVVPLPEAVATALREHRVLVPPTERDVIDSDGVTVHRVALVFTREDGSPANAENLRRPFTKASKTTGLPSSVTFHTLRHTYASLLIAAGTHLTVIRDRMGHSSITVTSDTYGHLYPSEDDRTRQAIDAAFSARTVPTSATATTKTAR